MVVVHFVYPTTSHCLLDDLHIDVLNIYISKIKGTIVRILSTSTTIV